MCTQLTWQTKVTNQGKVSFFGGNPSPTSMRLLLLVWGELESDTSWLNPELDSGQKSQGTSMLCCSSPAETQRWQHRQSYLGKEWKHLGSNGTRNQTSSRITASRQIITKALSGSISTLTTAIFSSFKYCRFQIWQQTIYFYLVPLHLWHHLGSSILFRNLNKLFTTRKVLTKILKTLATT